MNSSKPYAPPPPEASRRRRRGGLVWPVVLIFVGCVFLLQNTGYLPSNFWQNLWRLWPVILVLIGVELLLSQRVSGLILAALAIGVLFIAALATTNMAVPTESFVTLDDQKNLGEAREAAVTVRFGAGQLSIEPLENAAPDQLAVMRYEGPKDLAPVPRYTVSGPTGQLEYINEGLQGPSFTPFIGGRSSAGHLDVELSPSVPITSLGITAGAADAHLDLGDLRVTSLDISVGAASTWIRVPQNNPGLTTARISSGASSLTIEVPQGVAAQIRHQGGLSSLNVDEDRFPKAGQGLYRSRNYDSAPNRVDINLETGVTSVQVN